MKKKETLPQKLSEEYTLHASTLSKNEDFFTFFEKRLFALVLHQISSNPGISEFSFQIPIKELAKHIDYRYIPKTIELLQKRRIVNENSKKKQLSSHIVFPSIYYNQNQNGLLELKLNEALIPLFYNQSLQIRYNLENYLSLKTAYSQRLFEWLLFTSSSENGTNEVFIGIEDLQKELNSNYKTYKDFYKRVLQPAQTDILKSTALSFSIEVAERKVKKVIRLKFILENHTSFIQFEVKNPQPVLVEAPISESSESRESDDIPEGGFLANAPFFRDLNEREKEQWQRTNEKAAVAEISESEANNDYLTTMDFYNSADEKTQNELIKSSFSAYKFTNTQKLSIFSNAEYRQKFIEIHAKLLSGLLFATNPTNYILTVLGIN